jgi:hypothetical protein
MGIKSSSATAKARNDVFVQLEAYPPSATATATASVIFGVPGGSLGSPVALAVSPTQDGSLPPGSIHAEGDFDPSGLGVDTVSYDLSVTWSDGSVDDNGPSSVTLPAQTVTQTGPPPVVSPPVPDATIITWNTDSPGMGTVYYTPANGTEMSAPDDSDTSSTAHKVTLTDLIGSTPYTCHYETDLDDSDVNVVSNDFTFTTLPTVSVDPPGHVAMRALPCRLKVGGTSMVTVQVLKRDGSPQPGIAVEFSLGIGHATGTLSVTKSETDLNGQCQTAFTVQTIPPQQMRGRRFVVALVGDPSIKQKRRRALVVGLK